MVFASLQAGTMIDTRGSSLPAEWGDQFQTPHPPHPAGDTQVNDQNRAANDKSQDKKRIHATAMTGTGEGPQLRLARANRKHRRGQHIRRRRPRQQETAAPRPVEQPAPLVPQGNDKSLAIIARGGKKTVSAALSSPFLPRFAPGIPDQPSSLPSPAAGHSCPPSLGWGSTTTILSS